ncbi:MAG: PBP1A family penicillin-binding protein [Desulfovibrionaceae bacterium]
MTLKPFVKKTLLTLGILILVAGIGGGAAIAMLFYWAAQDLPNMTRIEDFKPPQATTILARDGSALGSLYHEKRYMVPLKEMSRYIPLAFLAAEDDSFYRHEGVDPIAIVRAAVINFQRGTVSQGGSTITQQIIKQLLLSSERKYKRKIKEAILAYRLERHLTKDEILTIYLNQIFLGQHSYGVEAAARTFFGKHASDITLAESAVLAGMPQAPSRYNPFRNAESAKARQMYVLGRLRNLNWVTQEEYDQAVKEPLVYWTMPESQGRGAGWYLEEVRRLLLEFFNEQNLATLGVETKQYGEDYVYEAGLTVHTAMDPRHQAAAEAALRKGLEDLGKRQGWQGPLEKISPDKWAEFKNKMSFTPIDFVGNAWAKALVTSVTPQGADVALGSHYKGHIDVKYVSWARTPNPKVAGINAPAVKDVRKVLEPGDVIWVSAVPSTETVTDAKGKKITQIAEYDPAGIKPNLPIALALEQIPPSQGALASIEPQSGDVVALVGGYQFGDSHFNRATQARRQPGSSFKPIVYSAALDKGFTASTMLLDAPFVHINQYTDQIWRPSNYEHNYKGPLPLHTALALSRNTCTVRVAQQIGIDAVNERAKALGLEPHFPRELSVSLGAVAVSPLNMTQAYTAFANQGWAARPRIITSITDANGKVLYTQDPQHWQAISPQNAYIMATLLKEVVNAGTAGRAKVLGKPMAGKTGTTNEEHDAWFMGFSPYLVTGVYMGYDQLQPLGRLEAGGRTAVPVFVDYRKEIEDQYPPDDFIMPEGIVMSNGQAYKADEPITGSVNMNNDPILEQNAEDLLKQLF